MIAPNKCTQIWGLALTNELTIASQFAAAKHKLPVHLWGTIMQGLYNKQQ